MSRRPLVLLLVVLGLLCCRRREPDRPALTPQQALSRTMQAAGSVSLTHLFELLDEKTRWSIMSVYKDQQKMCELIRTHYPKQVQARELRRCHLAASSRDVAAFFAAGWNDRALHDAVAVCALFNCMNRLVEGFGISASPEYYQVSSERLASERGYAVLTEILRNQQPLATH